MPLRYVECPRDSWQGFHKAIPPAEKRAYLQKLLDAGFRHLDLGSFVSPKAVPQMADAEEVLRELSRPADADFLCIIANEKGLERALTVESVSSVGYPLSVNDTFQRRNTNRSLTESWPLVENMFQTSSERDLGFVVYLSMGFGNPYAEPWRAEDTAAAVARLRDMGVKDIALADTVGSATPERIREVLNAIPDPAPLGLHLHARPDDWQGQLDVALEYGLSWLEGALGGIGGCPFADDHLVGNLPTEMVLPYLAQKGVEVGVGLEQLPELAQDARALRETYST